MLHLSCLVNNFMIFKKKKKEKERKKRKKNDGGGRIRSCDLWIMNSAPYRYAIEANYNIYVIKYVFISNMASRTIRPWTYAIPQF